MPFFFFSSWLNSSNNTDHLLLFFVLIKSEYESTTSTTTSLVCCNHCIGHFWTSVYKCHTKVCIRVNWPSGTFTTTSSSKCVSKTWTFFQSEKWNEISNFTCMFSMASGSVLLELPKSQACNLKQKHSERWYSQTGSLLSIFNVLDKYNQCCCV